MMKKLFTLFLAVLLLMGVMIPSAAASDNTPTGGSKEVYLQAEQVDENTVVYRDENGEILAVMKTVDDDSCTSGIQPRAKVYGFHMVLGPSEYDHVSQGYYAGNSVMLYYDITFSSIGDTYVGYYVARNDTYYWLDTTWTIGARNYVLIGTASNIYLAVKNISSHSIAYTGRYSNAEFDV